MTRFPGDAGLIIRIALIVAPLYLIGFSVYRLLQWPVCCRDSFRDHAMPLAVGSVSFRARRT